ncbi:hypothetical protein HZH66_013688 [Vespula vulgaris]|uniref:Uncharacterized protein n=1 Tax=Vespula vulgaris TaxID=7454 RepID=A0A834J6Z2_VESVU|nr:hypothetical protein HZH66_013688 [Vespula vulgaris]
MRNEETELEDGICGGREKIQQWGDCNKYVRGKGIRKEEGGKDTTIEKISKQREIQERVIKGLSQSQSYIGILSKIFSITIFVRCLFGSASSFFDSKLKLLPNAVHQKCFKIIRDTSISDIS